jgi:hypothetical protein
LDILTRTHKRTAHEKCLTFDHGKVVREPALTSIGKPARAFRDELICSLRGT